MERYEPASDFLKPLAAGEPIQQEMLSALIELTRDADSSNRDWATLLLAQNEIDTAGVRAAFVTTAQTDNDDVVRGEAILGLARRDPSVALPLVQAALASQQVSLPVFEAAALLADPSLIADLQDFAEPSGNPYLDEAALDALEACKGATPSPA